MEQSRPDDVSATPAPAPPPVSPDGRFYLDGGRWVPFPAQPLDRRVVARGARDAVGNLVAQLLLAVVVFPFVFGASVFAAHELAPARLATSAAVAAAVVVAGLTFWAFRALSD